MEYEYKERCISIIVPIYNSAQYLEQCLISLISQTYCNIEIICIDDGSIDVSSSIVLEYALKDKRICLIQQHNGGVSSARNAGLYIADGSYIMFVDSDDWADENYCRRMVEVALNQNADIVMCGHRKEFVDHSIDRFCFKKQLLIVGSDVQYKVWRRLIGPIKEELAVPYKVDLLVSPWQQLFRRNIVNDIKFFHVERSEDLLFQVETYLKCKRYVYIREPLYHFRQDNRASATHKYSNTLMFQWNSIYGRIKDILDGVNAEPIYYEALNNRIALSVIGICFNEIESRQSLKIKKHNLLRFMELPMNKNAFANLNLSYFPFVWRWFFLCCKRNNCLLVLSNCYILSFARKIKNLIIRNK